MPNVGCDNVHLSNDVVVDAQVAFEVLCLDRNLVGKVIAHKLQERLRLTRHLSNDVSEQPRRTIVAVPEEASDRAGGVIRHGGRLAGS